jgi:hypothetical protein
MERVLGENQKNMKKMTISGQKTALFSLFFGFDQRIGRRI